MDNKTNFTKEVLQSAKKHVLECSEILALMETPNEQLFTFLKEMHKADEANTEAARILHRLKAAATTTANKGNVQKAHSLLAKNVLLFAFMADKKTPIREFLHNVCEVNQNTKKVLFYLTKEIERRCNNEQ